MSNPITGFGPCLKKAFPYCAVVVALIIVYGLIFIMALQIKDPLNKVIFKIGDKGFSGWPISHLIFFFILGMLLPECHLAIMFLGVIWEILESIMGRVLKLFVKPRKSKEESSGIEYAVWMDGSYYDIIFNAIGLYMGILVGMVWKRRRKSLRA